VNAQQGLANPWENPYVRPRSSRSGTDSARFSFFKRNRFTGGTPAAAGSVPLSEVFEFMQIIVRDNNVDQALRALKKKLQREGVYREMKLRRHYEKPSEKRAREKAAAVRRARKLERKRMERDGIK
jgi:small subunit ribosomal protein S21